ncbi:MAG: hypothetical protein AABZ47_17860 [Planctomycetota bacterium]|mgnify:CR=1 FL=1
MYEHRRLPPVSKAEFLTRLAIHIAVAALMIGGSLALGMLGYIYYEGLAWRDAFLNAAMLLGGMGPVESPQTPGGKLFAGFYAMYAGLVFLVVVGIVFAPVVHRSLHRFHWEGEVKDQNSK